MLDGHREHVVQCPCIIKSENRLDKEPKRGLITGIARDAEDKKHKFRISYGEPEDGEGGYVYLEMWRENMALVERIEAKIGKPFIKWYVRTGLFTTTVMYGWEVSRERREMLRESISLACAFGRFLGAQSCKILWDEDAAA